LHIVESLKELSHQVTTFYYGDAIGDFYNWKRRKEQANKNQDLINIAKNLYHGSGLDLIFCYVYDDFLLTETAKALSLLGVPLVNYNVDMVNQWYRQTRTAKYFTLMLCAQKDNINNLKRYNPNILYFPMAARLPSSNPVSNTCFDPSKKVTFLGTPIPYRKYILSRLIEAGIPLSVFGKYWQENKEAMPGSGAEKLIKDILYYSNAKFKSESFGGIISALKRKLPKKIASKSYDLPPEIYFGFLPNEDVYHLFKKLAGSLYPSLLYPHIPGRA